MTDDHYDPKYMQQALIAATAVLPLLNTPLLATGSNAECGDISPRPRVSSRQAVVRCFYGTHFAEVKFLCVSTWSCT